MQALADEVEMEALQVRACSQETLSGKFPMGLGIPPLEIKILLGSKPLKCIMLVRRLAVVA